MDFRSFIELLDSRGELITIRTEVDRDYELGALLRQAEIRGMACRFDRVKGSAFRAAGAIMTSPERHAMSIGRSPDEFPDQDAIARLIRASWDAPVEPKIVDAGPVADVVLTGDRIDATSLPVPRFFSGDSHPFITAGLGFAMDPESGVLNVGFYRAPIIDHAHISAGASPNSNLMRIYKDAQARKSTLPLAMVIGAPPALLLTAGSRIPPEISDISVAGALQGGPIELIKCQTSDLLVPARAEMIIELMVDFDAEITHTMGEYGDQYGATTSPVAAITAITHRRDAVLHTIMGGMNREHNALGIYVFGHLRRELLDELTRKYPFVTDLAIDFTPRRGGARARLAVAIDKSGEQQPATIIDEIFGYYSGPFPMQRILQRVVVVDSDVNIHNRDDVEWAISTRMDETEKLTVYENQSPTGDVTTRLGIDATMNLSRRDRLERPAIPATERYRLEDYE